MNRKRTFIAVSLVIAVLDILFVAANYRLSRQDLEAELRSEARTLISAFKGAMKDAQATLQVVATVFANDRDVQRLFQQGKQAVASGPDAAEPLRRALYRTVAPQWRLAMQQLGARQLHFHLAPGALSFLRVHAPERYGDRLDEVRHMVVDTNRHKTPRSGFEIGRVYSGIRAAVPVFAARDTPAEGAHLGALEAGMSFENLVAHFAAATGTEVTVLLDRQNAARTMWPDYLAKHFADTDPESPHLQEAGSHPLPPAIAAQARKADPHRSHGEPRLIQDGDVYYFAASFSLRDYLGERDAQRPAIGEILLWRDISPRLSAFHHNQTFNLVYGALAFLLIEILLLLGFRHATRQLERQINERTRALSASEDRFRNLFEFTNSGVAIYRATDGGRNFILDDLNLAGARIFEVDKRELLCKKLTDALPSVAAHGLFDVLCRVYTSGKPEQHPVIQRQGERIVLWAEHYVYKLPSGEMVTIVDDITRQKRDEQALRFTQYALDHAADAAFWFKDDWPNFVYVNDRACHITGYGRERLLTMGPAHIDGLLLHENTAETLKEIKSRGGISFESRLKTRDGGNTPVEVVCNHAEFGGASYFICFMRDITQRQQVEKRLRESERYNRMLFEESPIGLALCRMDGRLVDLNPAFARIVGRSVEDTLRVNFWDFTPTPCGEAQAQQIMRLKGEGQYGPCNAECVHRDGHRVAVRLQGRLIRQDDEPFIWSSIEDISEQSAAQHALQASERRFKAQFRSIPIPTYIWKRESDDFVLMDCNDAAAALSHDALDRFVGRRLRELYPEQPDIQRDMAACADRRRPVRRQFWHRFNADATARFMDVTYTYVPDHLVQVHTEDITERHRAEQAVERAASEWRMVMDYFEDAVALIDPQRRLVRANKRFYAMTRSTPESAIGRPIAALMHPGGDHGLCPVCQTQPDHRDAQITLEADHPHNPSGRPLEITIKSIRDDDGTLRGMLVGIHDLSHTRRKEAELRLTRERLELAQQVAHLGNWELDLKSGAAAWSDEEFRLLGYRPGSVRAGVEGFLQAVHPGDREAVRRELDRTRHAGKEASFRIEHRVLLPDGNIRVVDQRGQLTLDAGGKPQRLFGTTQDITERKEAETQILRLLDENRALMRRNLDIQEAERRHLARELHDEMGQQVTAMRMDAAMIRESCTREDAPILEYAEDIEQIAGKLLATMRSVTNRLRPANLDYLGLTDTLRDTIDQWARQHRGPLVERRLEGDLEGLPESINIAVFRIVQEALTNVAKYASASRVDIEVRRTDDGRDGDRIELAIADDGCGMAPSAPARGMGLSGMRERVEALDGSFWLTSERDGGTRIAAVIPLERNADGIASRPDRT